MKLAKRGRAKTSVETTEEKPRPELARRKLNQKSSLKIGRTIGERRERLETANERAAARKKDKHKKILRVVFTIIGFIIIALILVGLYFGFHSANDYIATINSDDSPEIPKIEIVDEDSASTDGHLSSRMTEYIDQIVADFRELGLIATKAVIPTGTIREVNFYIEGYTGFIKTTIDRGAGVTTEDAERMLRYLSDQDVTDFEYIDVRIDGKAYWK